MDERHNLGLGKIGDAEEQVAGLQQMLVEKKFGTRSSLHVFGKRQQHMRDFCEACARKDAEGSWRDDGVPYDCRDDQVAPSMFAKCWLFDKVVITKDKGEAEEVSQARYW